MHHDANKRCPGDTVVEPTDFAEGDGESKKRRSSRSRSQFNFQIVKNQEKTYRGGCR